MTMKICYWQLCYLLKLLLSQFQNSISEHLGRSQFSYLQCFFTAVHQFISSHAYHPGSIPALTENCLTSAWGTTAWHRFINHSSSLMCCFFIAEESRMGSALLCLHLPFLLLLLNPAGIWLSAYIDQRLGELTQLEQHWCVHSVYKNVTVPANHLPSEQRVIWSRAKPKGSTVHQATRDSVLLCMGNMELANM